MKQENKTIKEIPYPKGITLNNSNMKKIISELNERSNRIESGEYRKQIAVNWMDYINDIKNKLKS